MTPQNGKHCILEKKSVSKLTVQRRAIVDLSKRAKSDWRFYRRPCSHIPLLFRYLMPLASLYVSPVPTGHQPSRHARRVVSDFSNGRQHPPWLIAHLLAPTAQARV